MLPLEAVYNVLKEINFSNILKPSTSIAQHKSEGVKLDVGTTGVSGGKSIDEHCSHRQIAGRNMVKCDIILVREELNSKCYQVTILQ